MINFVGISSNVSLSLNEEESSSSSISGIIQLTNHSLKLTQGSMTSFLSFIIHENNRVV